VIPFPDKKYNIIYADPPWSYENKASEGAVNDQYDTLTITAIKNLPVRKIVDNNCALFLWVTFPLLQEGLDTITAWGFQYKTLGFSWIKTNSNDNKPFFGIGNYTKSNCELCLLGVKGSVAKMVKDDSISSVLISKLGSHSQKPYQVRDRIVQLLGDIPRIELFARHKINGWDQWGNQVPLYNIMDFC
jgi:N6-adenosine-specific RNA methylase IME4